jgi:hypothetical protein
MENYTSPVFLEAVHNSPESSRLVISTRMTVIDNRHLCILAVTIRFQPKLNEYVKLIHFCED